MTPARRQRLEILPGGLLVAGEEIPGSELTALHLRLAFGAIDDPPSKRGLAHLTQELLWRGTATKDVTAIENELDRLGVRRGSSCGLERSSFDAVFLPEHRARVLALLGELLSGAVFPEAELATERELARQELARLEDLPQAKVRRVLWEAHLGEPLGREVLGTPAGLAAARREDLAGFWRARARRPGVWISLAGKFDWEATLQELSAALGGLAPGLPPELAPPSFDPGPHTSADAPRRIHLTKPTEQVQLALAFGSVTRAHPRYAAARVYVGLLSGGMSCRLFTEVREKRGLVYGVHAYGRALRARSAIAADASTTPARAAETLRVLTATLAGVRDGIEAEELARAETLLTSRLVTLDEIAEARAHALAEDLYCEGRIVPLAEKLARLERVTAREVLAYLEEFPPVPETVVTLGPTAPEPEAEGGGA